MLVFLKNVIFIVVFNSHDIHLLYINTSNLNILLTSHQESLIYEPINLKLDCIRYSPLICVLVNVTANCQYFILPSFQLYRED